jgi:hypothetical protein
MSKRMPNIVERKKPSACKMIQFSGFEIRIIERTTYHKDGTESYTYEPQMIRKSKLGSKYHTRLVVGRNITALNQRYSASGSAAIDDAMIFDNPDIAQYAAIVATWRWIQDGLGSWCHEIN